MQWNKVAVIKVLPENIFIQISLYPSHFQIPVQNKLTPKSFLVVKTLERANLKMLRPPPTPSPNKFAFHPPSTSVAPPPFPSDYGAQSTTWSTIRHFWMCLEVKHLTCSLRIVPAQVSSKIIGVLIIIYGDGLKVHLKRAGRHFSCKRDTG